ncbi:MAG: AzlC family ABC transporter permease [Acidimicrobiales bacterium]|nr:AzlC family ABC transporter permease [Acidimicrobiales bacterium]
MAVTDHRRSAIRQAAGDTVGVGLGLFPIGMAFGLLVVQSGLEWWWAPVFSFLVYAGSMEFLLIGLVTATTPIASIAVTTLLVNGRHAFYGLSFPLHRIRHRLGRAYSVYALTDEAYALAATQSDEELSGTRIVAIQAFCQTYWVTGGIVGALTGAAIPGDVEGLAFALTALFVVLAIDAIRATGDAPTPLVALAAALVAMRVAPERMLLVALGLFTVALLVRYRFTGSRSWPGRRAAPEAMHRAG